MQTGVLVTGSDRERITLLAHVVRAAGLRGDVEADGASDASVASTMTRPPVEDLDERMVEASGWTRDGPPAAPGPSPALDPQLLDAGRRLVAGLGRDQAGWFVADPALALLLPWWRRILRDRFVTLVAAPSPWDAACTGEESWPSEPRTSLPPGLRPVLAAAYLRHLAAGLDGLPAVVVDVDALRDRPGEVTPALLGYLRDLGVEATLGVAAAVAAVRKAARLEAGTARALGTDPPEDRDAAEWASIRAVLAAWRPATSAVFERFRLSVPGPLPWETLVLEVQREAGRHELALEARTRAAEADRVRLRRERDEARERAARLDTQRRALVRQVDAAQADIRSSKQEAAALRSRSAVTEASVADYERMVLVRARRRLSSLGKRVLPGHIRRALEWRLVGVGLLKNPLLDEDWYLARYPDVKARGANPNRHFRRHGAAEGRDPNALFRTSWYLDRYPDVRSNGMNALDHYLRIGAAENRDPSVAFDTRWYLETYPDVRSSGMNPLLHYLRHGAREGRRTLPGSAHASAGTAADTPAHAFGAVGARLRRQRTRHVPGEAAPRDRSLPLRVAYLLTTRGGGGGAHSVVQEARGLRRLGVDAHILVPTTYAEEYVELYPETLASGDSDLFDAIDLDSEPGVARLVERAGGFDCVVATIHHSVQYLERIWAAHPQVLPAYYIQDYEPWFYEEGSAERLEAAASYEAIPGLLAFAKTPWLAQTVSARHGLEVVTVSPSLDHAVYHPPEAARPDGRVRIAAMVRPASRQRAPLRTLRVLRRIADALGDRVELRIFGSDDAELAGMVEGAVLQNQGRLTRDGVADVLRWAHVFIDLSDWQAFGRTGLEAMASGCAVVLPQAGGASLFAESEHNCLLVDTRDEEACHAAVRRLATDPDLVRDLAVEGQLTAARFSVDRAAASVLAVLENAANVRGLTDRETASAADVAQRMRLQTLVGEHPTPGASIADRAGMPAPPSARKQAVDIIVCVHDAPEDVRRCLASVLATTTPPYSLILVDDGSQPETRDLLRSFAHDHAATLLRNEEACGYTRAANQGLSATSAALVVLLNSDTVVTPGWLERLAACAASGPDVGMVGPLSNSATWQSVPEVVHEGTWARNTLPPGWSPADMARAVAQASDRVYPEVAFLNGFCLMIRRELIDAIGTFDEEHFGRGYGEENDYCVRSRQAGWRLLVADDAYVFHRGSGSYTAERRAELIPAASQALEELHGRSEVQAGVDAMRGHRLLAGVRARVSVADARERLIQDGAGRWQGRRVAFVLPTARQGGGANVVILLGRAMRRMGVRVDLVNLEANRVPFEECHPDLGLPVRYLASQAGMSGIAPDYDAVVATHHRSVSWVQPDALGGRKVEGAYLIQDMEAWFFEPGSPDRELAIDSYARSDHLRCFATTDWVRDTVAAAVGVDSLVIGALADIDRFRPRRRQAGELPERPLRVAAMIRPETARRGAARTMGILRALKAEQGAGLEVVIFGSAPDHPALADVATDFPFVDLGPISSGQVATLLNECDLFLDLSDWQAMGLTAMEAMACGVAVVVPEQGGATSIVNDGVNGRVVDTRSFGDCLAAARDLLADDELRRTLATHAIRDVVSNHPERAAHALLSALFPSRHADLTRSGTEVAAAVAS